MKTVQGPSGAARSSVHPIGPERERDLRRTLDERVALPLWAFRDPSYHELEMRCLFHNDWVFACFAEELANPGDYCAFTVAGEPVVMIRGRDGEIRAMSNSCRHRGTPLVAGAGNASSFSCPYHGWTYSDDGSLVGVPFANRNSFDRSSHWLPRFRVEVWNELVFVSLNPDIEPLSDRFAGLEAHLGSDLFPGYERNRVARSAHATWPVNWKLCFEQGVDTYHVFKVHAKTLASEFPTKDAFFVDGTTKWAINGVGRDATEIYSNGPAGQVSEIQDNGLLQVSMRLHSRC